MKKNIKQIITIAAILLALVTLLTGCGSGEKQKSKNLEGKWQIRGACLLDRTEGMFDTDIYFDYAQAQECYMSIADYEPWIIEKGAIRSWLNEEDSIEITMQYPGSEEEPPEYGAVYHYGATDKDEDWKFISKEGKYEGTVLRMPVRIMRGYDAGVEKMMLLCEDGLLYVPFYQRLNGENYTEYGIFERVK